MDLFRELLLRGGELLLASIVAGCALTLFVRLATIAMSRYLNASTRYVIWLVTLAAVALMPLLLVVRSLPEREPVRQPASITRLAVRPTLTANAPAVVETSTATPTIEVPVTTDGVVVIGLLWLACVSVGLLRICRSYLQIRKLKRDARPVAAEAYERWSAVLGSWPGDRTPLIKSADVGSPMAVGYRRPTVLLPDSLLLTVRGTDLDAILVHELAHVRRGDDFARLLQAFVRSVWFFHPAIHYISARLDLERELACDDAVLAMAYSGREYARSLTLILEQQSTRTHPYLALVSGAAFRRKQIVQRVRALLDRTRNRVPSVSPVALVVVLACAAGFAGNLVDLPELVDLVDEGSGGQVYRSEWNDERGTVFFEVRGEWDITDDRDVLASLPAGTVVRVGEGRWIRRYFEYQRSPEGVLAVRYRNGKHEETVDAGLRRRGDEALLCALRDSGYGLASRADRLLDQGGVAAVLAEIDQSRSEHIRSEYLKHLLNSSTIAGEALSKVISRIARLNDDHQQAELLLLLAEREPGLPAQVAVAYGAREIGDSHAKQQVIEHLMQLPEISTSADLQRSLLRAIDSLGGSAARADLLLHLLRDATLSDTATAEITTSAGKIESGEQRARILDTLAQRPLSPVLGARVARAASTLEADKPKADILVRLAAQSPHADYIAAVRSLRSDEQRQRVLRAMIGRNKSAEAARTAAELADMISADAQRAEILLELAALRPSAPQVEEPIRRSAKRLASSEDYRKIMTALGE